MSSEGVPDALGLSGRLSKISKWGWPKLFSNDYLCAGTRECMRFCTHLLRAAYFLQPSGSPESNSCWHQNQMFWELVFPRQWPALGSMMRAQTPCSLGRTSAIVINLPFVHHPPRGMGLDYIAALLLLAVSLWFLPCILSCKSFLLDFWFLSFIIAL